MPADSSARIGALPTPSGYRDAHPRVLGPPPQSPKARFFERKRVIVGFAIAAVLHVGLVLAWWLTPPLRLKAGYAPERWVPVSSLPAPRAEKPPAVPAPKTSIRPQPAPVTHTSHSGAADLLQP